MTERNAPLLRQVADIIENNPDKFNQSSWGEAGLDEFTLQLPSGDTVTACGTAHCVAGFTAAISGYKPIGLKRVEYSPEVRDFVETGQIEFLWSYVSTEPVLVDSHTDLYDNYRHTLIQDVARDLLGLKQHESETLFDTRFMCAEACELVGVDEDDFAEGYLSSEETARTRAEQAKLIAYELRNLANGGELL